jgi:hypothetical protein
MGGAGVRSAIQDAGPTPAPQTEGIACLRGWVKLIGDINEEIAGKPMMDCAVRTVERKLGLIRQLWEEAT